MKNTIVIVGMWIVSLFLAVLLTLQFANYWSNLSPKAKNELLGGAGTPPVPPVTNPVPLIHPLNARDQSQTASKYDRGVDPPVESNAPTPALPPPTPKSGIKVVSLLPGQHTDIPNRDYRKLEFHSEYPVDIVSGDCHADEVVQWRCDGDPADIFIIDTRHPPVFATPRANTIAIKATEY